MSLVRTPDSQAGKKLVFLFIPLLILFALFFAGALPAKSGVTRSFSVKSFTPEGLVEGPIQIRLEFSSDAVASADVGRDLKADELPIGISPPLSGYGKWLSASTFIYQPSNGFLASATRYSVTVNERLSDMAGNRLVGKRAFEMHTAPLVFRGARQVDFDVASDFVAYELSFSLPVKASRLEGFLSIRDGKGNKVPFSVTGEAFSDRIAIRVNAGDGSPVTIGVEKGMTAEGGPLGLEKTQSFKVERDLSLVVRRAQTRSDLSGSYIELETSAPLDIAKAPAFIKISGSEKVQADKVLVEASWGNVTRIRGSFKPRDRVTLKLLKGLPSAGGPALSDEWERAFIISDMEEDIRFTSQGRFISPAGERLLMPLQSVNVEKVRVRVHRVYDNNVSVVMVRDWPYYPEDLSETVFDKTYPIQGGANEIAERAIDLRSATGGRKGLFLIRAGNEGSWQEASQVINITDIAGSMRLGPDSALVWATSISGGKPLKDVEVTIWSRSNQPLGEGKTNADGIWEFKRNERWDSALRPDFATLRLGDDTAVLRLDENLWDSSGLDLSGRPYPGKGYQALCYTPRGVFRPGERVPMQLLLRDENLSLKEPFPVQVKVYTPTGREWKTYTPMLSPMGMGSVLIQLSEAAPTGTWTADVRIPGDERSVGRVRFAVEDFAPPRISVKTKANRKELATGDKATLHVDAKYLFGAQADGLAYETEMTFIPRKYTHKDWPNFIFADDRVEFEAESTNIGSGNLSMNGQADVQFEVGTMAPPSVIDVALRTGVMEDSGRWVYNTTTLPYYPYPVLLGIQGPQGTLVANAKLPFRVAAIDRNGKAADLKNIELQIFKVSHQPQVSRNSGRTNSEMQEELVVVEERKVALVNGTASVDVTLKSGGEYVVAVEDPKTRASASWRFYVYDSSWAAGDAPATLPERLDVTLDKELYKPGDNAKVRIRGAFDGAVLLTVETDRVVYSAAGTAKDGQAELSFKVTDGMSPNAWVTAQLVRPAVEEEEWTGHRASGAVPISIDCTPKRLDLAMTLPEQLKPRAKNDFSLQLKDASGKGVAGEVSLMLVDDGVLELTRYATPNPFDFYTSRRALGMTAFDVYDELLPLYAKMPKLLSPGGGEGEDMAEAALYKAAMSPVRADRFKILTLYKRVKTDANGKADFSFVLPEFSGRARLMAVAASAGAFGNAEARFTVAREVVAELSLPRAAAPGDSFTAQVQLFNRSEASQDVRYELALTGPLQAKKRTGSVALAPGDRGVALVPVSMVASGDSGLATVKLTIRYAGKTNSQIVELPIRPPYPRVSKTGSFALEPGKSRTLALPGDWMPGTRRGILTASGMPTVQFADLARFLVDYPYYCLEQTVSSGWALLAQPQLVQNLDPALATPKQISAALGERLRRIQSLQMYNGAFASWPGIFSDSGYTATAWNSVYTTHFLVACEKARIQVPKDTLKYARNYLQELIAMAPASLDDNRFAGELTLRAYACYVLSLGEETPPLAWMSYLKDNLGSMTPSGRIILVATYARAGQKDYARAMLAENAPAIDEYKPSQREGLNLDSNLRTLALYLMAWNEIDPTSPGAATAAANVLTALRATPYITTQEAAFALSNLGNFFLFNKETGKAKMVSSPRDLLSATSDDEILRGSIPENLATATLSNRGDGRGFVSWSVDGVPLKAPVPEDSGLRVRLRLADSTGNALKPDASIRRGAKVLGTITLDPLGGPSRNIVVSMPLAGGLEIENPRLMDAASETGETLSGVRQEMRDDRLLLFIDELNLPTVWNFSMRAVTPGTFALPPILAEGMYSPGVRSITAGGTIAIAPAK